MSTRSNDDWPTWRAHFSRFSKQKNGNMRMGCMQLWWWDRSEMTYWFNSFRWCARGNDMLREKMYAVVLNIFREPSILSVLSSCEVVCIAKSSLTNSHSLVVRCQSDDVMLMQSRCRLVSESVLEYGQSKGLLYAKIMLRVVRFVLCPQTAPAMRLQVVGLNISPTRAP